MKKIINGKVYDTRTAINLAECDHGAPGDLHYVCEALYRKRTGEFFLHGEGGPASKYSESTGMNQWSGGEKIIPLDWDAAREWGEENLSTAKYEEIFGEIVEDDSRVTVTMSLSAGSVERAKRAAAQAGMSLSAYIESLI